MTQVQQQDGDHHCQQTIEHPNDYKRRKLSHYVVYFTITSSSLFYSALMVSLWPYLNRLDNDADKTFYGYLAATGAVATTLTCPLFGKWSNTLKSSRTPFIITLVCGAINYAIYVNLPMVNVASSRYWFLLARFMTGLNDVNIGLSRGYIAESTLGSERRSAVAILTGCQTIAFACGPALQSLMVPLGESGIWLVEGYIKVDMYTAVGWLALVTLLINIALFHPVVFTHSDVRHVERTTGSNVCINRYYKRIAWFFMLLQALLICNYLLLKVIGTPLVMDQYAMTRQDALQVNSYIVSGGAVVSLVAIIVMDPMCKKWGEMNIMYMGFVIMFIGRFLMYPMGTEVIAIAANQTDLGCPQWSQSWCFEEKQMHMWQFIASNIFDNFGYSWAITLIYTKFSHILGSKQQGTWMGLITSLSGAARIISPVVVSWIYVAYGNAFSILATNFMYIGFALLIFWLIHYFTKKGQPSEVSLEEDAGDVLIWQNGKEMKELKH